MNSYQTEDTANLYPKVVVIFASKNEENTIENSVAMAKKSYYKPEVIVVDAYSSDKTPELAATAGASRNTTIKAFVSRKGLGYERRIGRSDC